MTDDRAMRVAVAAGEQVAASNSALAAAQRKAWARFIRHVWAGGPTDTTNRSEQFVAGCDKRMSPDDETVRA